MSKSFKRELAAQVLVEALYTADNVTCAKYGISIRSLQNYRKRLATDAGLALIFARRQSELYGKWADEVPIALCKAIRFIGAATDAVAADERMKKNPIVIEAVANAMRMVAEVGFANQIISARLNPTDRPQDDYPKQIPAESSAYSN